jgi:hypothetical protein
MDTVFRLKENPRRIANVQNATLTTLDYGIAVTHGLFGSDAWWDEIDTGHLATRTLRGRIMRVYMAGHNDWPEFEMKSDDDTLSRWERSCDRPEDDRLFVVGRRVEIDIVLQRHRLQGRPAAPTEIVIEIRIDDAA